VKKNVIRLIEEVVKPNESILYQQIPLNSSSNFNVKISVNSDTRQELKFRNPREIIEMKKFAQDVLSKSFIQKFLDKYKNIPPRNFHYASRNV
jgi:hypothetical protein